MFQFQIGAIGSRCPQLSLGYRRKFQFQIGAIGSFVIQFPPFSFCEFQFQIGAIGRGCEAQNDNSLLTFQFQIGAIGSQNKILLTNSGASFNSRLVRLAVYLYSLITDPNTSFNSRLVRLAESMLSDANSHLDVSIPDWCDWQRVAWRLFIMPHRFQFQIGPIGSDGFFTKSKRISVFQFQIGPIGSIIPGYLPIFDHSFNSRLVRLVELHSFRLMFEDAVSIPDWYDW